jgi:hypothetical protein
MTNSFGLTRQSKVRAAARLCDRELFTGHLKSLLRRPETCSAATALSSGLSFPLATRSVEGSADFRLDCGLRKQ